MFATVMAKHLDRIRAELRRNANQAMDGIDAQVEARREAALEQLMLAATEVALTPMSTLSAIACKAAYLAELLEEPEGDLASQLAKSLTEDVLALAATRRPPTHPQAAS